jgi:hypothetical protein
MKSITLPISNHQIKIRTKEIINGNKFLNATDLERAMKASKELKVEKTDTRFVHYLDVNATKEYLKHLLKSSTISTTSNCASDAQLEVPENKGFFFDEELLEKAKETFIITTKGRYGSTWVHPDLFLDYASWLSPQWKQWVYDCFKQYGILVLSDDPDAKMEIARELRETGIEQKVAELETLEGTYPENDRFISARERVNAQQDYLDADSRMTWLIDYVCKSENLDKDEVSQVFAVIMEEICVGLFGVPPYQLRLKLSKMGIKNLRGREFYSPAMFSATKDAADKWTRWFLAMLKAKRPYDFNLCKQRAYMYAEQAFRTEFEIHEFIEQPMAVVCKDTITQQTQVYIDKDRNLSEPVVFEKTKNQQLSYKQAKELEDYRKGVRKEVKVTYNLDDLMDDL